MMTFFITFERYFTNGFRVIMGNCLNDTIFSIVLESGIGTLWNIRLSHARARVSNARHARQGDRVYVVHGEWLECMIYFSSVNTFLTTTLVKSKNNPPYTVILFLSVTKLTIATRSNLSRNVCSKTQECNVSITENDYMYIFLNYSPLFNSPFFQKCAFLACHNYWHVGLFHAEKVRAPWQLLGFSDRRKTSNTLYRWYI